MSVQRQFSCPLLVLCSDMTPEEGGGGGGLGAVETYL